LNSIIGFTSRLLSKLTLEERNLEALQAVENNGKHLLNLINDLLDTARIESGSIKLRRETFSITELSQLALSQTQPLIEDKGLQLITEFSSPQIQVFADRKLLLQIMLNLLSNAIKYTLAGKVTLAISESTQQGIEGVQLAVSDTGMGISENDIPRLFGRFSRLETSQSNSIQGTGLGLMLIKELTELHGGRVDVASTLGSGSCFSIWIPHQPSDT
jgi:signal transduction histidine kinase